MFNFDKYIKPINEICKKNGVASLIVFGSSITNEFNKISDIDCLLTFKNPKDGIIKYMKLKKDLETLFSRKVDLVMPRAIKNNRIKKYIYSETRVLYAA